MRPIRDGSFYLIRKLWYALALGLVLLAMLVTAARFMLPRLGHYQEDLVQWLEQRFEVELAVEQVAARWTLTGPELVLEHTRILLPKVSDTALSFDQLRLDVDVWRSLLAMQPRVRELALDGFSLHIQAEAPPQSELEVEGPSPQTTSPDRLLAVTSAALEVFDQIRLQNAELAVTLVDGERLDLKLPELAWGKRASSYVGQGEVQLEQEQPGLRFQLRLPMQHSVQQAGQVFVESDGIVLTPLLQRWVPDIPWRQAVFAGRGWLDWQQGELQWARLMLQGSELALADSVLPALEGDLRWQRSGNGWQVAGTDLHLFDQMPQTDFKLAVEQQRWRGYLSAMSLQPLSELALSSGLLPESATEALSALKPRGELSQLQLVWDNATSQLLGLSGQAEQLGWQSWQQLPGLSQLSGEFAWLPDHGEAELRVTGGVLDYSLFPQPLELDALQARVSVSQQQDLLRLTVPQLSVITPHLSLSSQLELDLPADGTPELYLYGELFDLQAENAGRYFPEAVMSDLLVDYLNGSLLGGDIERAQVLFNGPLSSFPFEDQRGIFQVIAPLRNANFDFDPFSGEQGWANLSPLSLDLLFTDASLTMVGRSEKSGVAMMGGSQIPRLKAEIPYLGAGAQLLIDADVEGDGRELSQMLLDSPVRDPVGRVLDRFQISGSVTGALQLTIPLTKKKDADGKETKSPVVIKGSAQLKENHVDLVDMGLKLENASGEISFDTANVSSSEINGELYGQPVVVAFDGQPKDGGYQTNVNLRGNWQADDLKQQFDELLLERIDGSFSWDGAVKVYSKDGRHQYKAEVTSNLVGLSTSLPLDSNKQPSERWPLRIRAEGDLEQADITLELAQQARGLVELARVDNKLVINRANLALGPDAPLALPRNADRFSVSARYSHMAVQPWFDFVTELIRDRQAKQQSARQSELAEQPRRAFWPAISSIQIESRQVTLTDGMTMDNVRLVGSPQDDGWLLRLRADQTSTRIRLGEQQQRLAVNIDSDFIQLPALADTEPDSSSSESKSESKPTAPQSATSLRPASMPLITFRCLDCKLGQLDLGRLSFQVAPDQQQPERLDLTVAIDAGSTRMQANGQWRPQEGMRDLVVWQGDFYTRRVDKFIAGFGRASVIQDSEADINFNLRWRGQPWAPEISSLDGQINWQLGEGTIDEVSDKGVRVFSLLSLDSLRRKLALDFRDVFSKGLFYNSMKGRLVLDKGTAYSTDTTMDGMAGDLDIRGWINLNNRQIDYDLVFLPKLTSSLPVITAFAITPVTGVVVYALSKAFEPVVNVVTQIHFKATGSVDNPKFDEVSRSRGEVKIPKEKLPPGARERTD